MFVPAVTGSNQAPRPTAAPAVHAVAVKAAPVPHTADVQRAIAAIRETLRPVSNGLEFSVDHGSGKTIVRVVDLESGQLIRQIPTVEIVEIARVLERLEGLLFRQRA
jgi:flagellar protein FlaG